MREQFPATEPAQLTRANPVRLAEIIMARITSSEYAVGEKLPAEKELARQFGVSRPSVREALRALQFVGYIDSVRGSGTRVISRSGTQGIKTRTAAVTATDILQLFEARIVLEPQVAAIAARDPDLDNLERAEGLVSGMGLVINEPTLQGETDLLVHRGIAQVCRNVFLRQSLIDLLDAAGSDQLASVRNHAWGGPELPRVWENQQQRIVRAIRDRDERTAAAASWEHVASSARNALAVVSTEPELDQQTVDRLVTMLDRGPSGAVLEQNPTTEPTVRRMLDTGRGRR